MARKLETLIGSPNDVADLQPLLGNSTYAKQAQEQIDLADAAAEKAATAASLHEDFVSVATQFSNAIRACRTIAKRFPECAKFTDEAIKQVQLAMNAAVGNPPEQPEPKPAPAPAPAPTPAPAPQPVRP